MNNDLVNSIKSKITEIDKLISEDYFDLYTEEGEYYDNILYSYEKIGHKIDIIENILKTEFPNYRKKGWVNDRDLVKNVKTRRAELYTQYYGDDEDDDPRTHLDLFLDKVDKYKKSSILLEVIFEQHKLFNILKTDINKFISDCNQSKTGEIATVMARQSNINLPPDIRNTIASFNKGGKSKKKNRKTKRRYT